MLNLIKWGQSLSPFENFHTSWWNCWTFEQSEFAWAWHQQSKWREKWDYHHIERISIVKKLTLSRRRQNVLNRYGCSALFYVWMEGLEVVVTDQLLWILFGLNWIGLDLWKEPFWCGISTRSLRGRVGIEMDMILTSTGFYRFSKRARWKIPIWYQNYFIRGKKLFRIRETRRHDTTCGGSHEHTCHQICSVPAPSLRLSLANSN